jgi:molybdate transport system substrate-binding protein
MVIGQTMSRPLTGISSMATRNVLTELAGAYERSSGQRVVIESVGGVAAVQRIQDGESFDIVVLADDAINRLAAAGRVQRGSRIGMARSGIALAVTAGALRPEIGDEASVRDAVLAARGIGYSTGPSGSYLTRLFERWGIAETIAPRMVQAPPGVPVGALVARGDVELGFQQLSELMHLPGIDVIGLLPPDIQLITVFSAAICTVSTQIEAAKALLAFLASPEADSVKLAHGMEPA